MTDVQGAVPACKHAREYAMNPIVVRAERLHSIRRFWWLIFQQDVGPSCHTWNGGSERVMELDCWDWPGMPTGSGIQFRTYTDFTPDHGLVAFVGKN